MHASHFPDEDIQIPETTASGPIPMKYKALIASLCMMGAIDLYQDMRYFNGIKVEPVVQPREDK